MTASPILTAAQMTACDRYTIEILGIPSRTLMERAAAKAARFLLSRPDLFLEGPVLVLCGAGNNGGDGFAMARFLTDGSLGQRRETRILYLGRRLANGEPDPCSMSEECRRQYSLAAEAGVPILTAGEGETALRGAVAAVDAVFGIGLDRPITGESATWLRTVGERRIPTLAVDIPSGIRADTGEILGYALPAAATVTMQALKPGLLLYPGAELCGEITVAELGIDLTPAKPPYAHLADEAVLRRALPPRPRRSHKGTYGTLALLCGSAGMSGAAVLAARAALRCGVGLARVLTPEVNRTVLQITVPEATVSVYATPGEAAGSAGAEGLVAGCGLGFTPEGREVLRAVLDAPGDPTMPLVLDADGLNHLAADPTLWQTARLSAVGRHTVFTPHPLEMARLTGCSVSDLLADLPGAALSYARERGVTVVLKDAHTVIASPDGELFICTAGNAGLAKGGSGDTLAGIIGALLTQNRRRLGQEVTVAQVAAAGVYLHAAAADRAARELGEYGLLAGDVIDRLPLVCAPFSDSRTSVGKL